MLATTTRCIPCSNKFTAIGYHRDITGKQNKAAEANEYSALLPMTIIKHIIVLSLSHINT